MSEQFSLFHSSLSSPLAFKLRPKELKDYAGQHKLLKRIESLNNKNLPHLIFYGPPGTGKTTMAHLLSLKTGSTLHEFNAVLGGVPELRKLIDDVLKITTTKKHIIFIDEIHRFNKSQQDALLPYLEKGSFILIGATTEYPWTALNKALLSRVTLLELEKLKDDEILTILERAIQKENINIDDEVLTYIASYSNGDARFALNVLEELSYKEENERTIYEAKVIFSKQARQYDKNQNQHYNVISAFIKSMRGSDPDAALLYLAIMLDGGEDPLFITRRLMIFASEDIGLANSEALMLATSCHQALMSVGMPEGRIILSHTVLALTLSPKSNSAYNAINEAMAYVASKPTIEVPTHLQNNHPDSKKYKYPHNFQKSFVKQKYTEESITFYKPTENGKEKEIFGSFKEITN